MAAASASLMTNIPGAWAFRRIAGKSLSRGSRPQGLGSSYTREEVQRAYRMAMHRHHPDHHGDNDVVARTLTTARDTLLATRSRAAGRGKMPARARLSVGKRLHSRVLQNLVSLSAPRIGQLRSGCETKVLVVRMNSPGEAAPGPPSLKKLSWWQVLLIP